MNACLFFEGTGQGVAGRITNVTRLHDACVEDKDQVLHLEPGVGTHFGSYLRGMLHGHDWWLVFRGARRWFEANFRPAEPEVKPAKVFVFGFSRGALIARHFAAWLEKLDVEVAYLGLWDTVDATLGLDVTEEMPSSVRSARHALSRDEKRRFYTHIPLRPAAGGAKSAGIVEELVFPGSHSDVGGLFEDDHTVADAALAWIAEGAVNSGMRLADMSVLTPTIDVSKMVLHDSHDEATNLWGALGSVGRNLEGVSCHPLCAAGNRAINAGVLL
jgi:uncharacterized protein (DUF2235 family)